jgi:predicted anti-sigma-YlaC factor YlaD
VHLLEASCTTASEALSDRLEGELRGLRRFRVARHLARCGRCQAALASLARLVSLLRTIPDPEPGDAGSAVDGVLARVRGESAVDDGG